MVKANRNECHSNGDDGGNQDSQDGSEMKQCKPVKVKKKRGRRPKPFLAYQEGLVKKIAELEWKMENDKTMESVQRRKLGNKISAL